MKAMTIGDMRHRLVIETPVDTVDENGDRRTAFQDAGEMWGLIEPTRGEARFVADRPEYSISHIVHARWRADLSAGMRMRSADRKLRIRAVLNPDESKIQMLCLCEEAP